MKKLAGLFLVTMLLLAQFAVGVPLLTHAATGQNTVTVSVVKKDGTAIIDHATTTFSKDDTALSVLKRVTNHKGVKLNAPVSDQYGAYIKGIGGVVPKQPDYWGFFINGKSAQVGVSSYKVKSGDELSFKVMTYTPPANQDDSGSNSGSATSGSTDQPEVTEKQISNAHNQSLQVVMKNGVDTAWEAVGVRKSGKTVPASYLDSLKQTLQKKNGQFQNVTDYERIALGATAAGGNATDVGGYNLIKDIYTNEKMTTQGTNGVIYGLIALDSGHYQVPKNAKWTRDKLIHYLLKKQLKDGGWALNGSSSDVDITAMALTALAPYQDRSDVKSASKKAVDWLSKAQKQNGGFSTSTGDTSESISAVITALSAVGVDSGGKSFTKSGHNLLGVLLSFQQKDGGFAHEKKDKVNTISTAQALIALAAYQGYSNGKGSVYQFSSPDPQNASGQNSKPSPTNAVNPYIWILIGAVALAIVVCWFVYRRRKKV